MVKKEQSKRQKSIKSKLMAAVCMLLVSCIMMVSSTYAWFTLSTAPEVTGITTAVGANGNLEIALMPTDGLSTTNADFGITTGSSDSIQDWSVKNLTWGNLVDLSDSNFYGLEKIVLYPSQLNVATWDDENAKLNPETLSDTFLSTPSYGSDGRVSGLVANTVTSTYSSSDKNFPVNDLYGVRAVGTASGMTDRQLAYRNARSAANTAMAQATNYAGQSLSTNGNALANIAVAHGVDKSATHDQEDVAALLAIVDDLLGYDDGNGDHVTGVLEYIETAYIQNIIALGASLAAQNGGLSDAAFSTFQSSVEAATSLEAAIKVLTDNGYTNLPAWLVIDADDGVVSAVEQLLATKEKVQTAQNELKDLKSGGSDAITWTAISVPLYRLADTDAMTINGIEAKDITTDDGINHLISTIGGGLTVSMATGGGVYADIADHCGDYKAGIVIDQINYGGLSVTNLAANMATATTVKPSYLSGLSTAVGGLGSPASGSDNDVPITDMFGYIIDLAFRTNAAESNLLLQDEAIDRIYESNTSDSESMGHGTNMTFTSTTANFTVDQMKELMKAIRIVFFNPSDKSVYATAKLDVAAATVTNGNTVTAEMYIYTVSSGSTEGYQSVTYAANSGKTYYKKTETYSEVADPATAQVQLYTKAADSETYSEAEYDAEATDVTYFQKNVAYEAIDDTTASTYEGTLFEKKTTTSGEVRSTDNVITSLTQNTATAVSILVYLDGNYVGNDDVAATAATSMTGSMNLQFASSASLVPMNYTPLVSQTGSGNSGGSDDTTGDDETSISITPTLSAPNGITVSNVLPHANGGYGFNMYLPEGDAASNYTVTATVNGTAVDLTIDSNGTYCIAEDKITANTDTVAITVVAK